ncbi:hypothetical protein [Planktothricoides raciborskii]|uniref:Uncharacterized protein n=1 Tax=Planktothricoides raciborskii GIHE-MW2 TaxID=2792601 RepID=A0AAU8JK42_9CYAN
MGIAQQNFRRSQSKLLWWVILTRFKIPSLLIEAINNLENLGLLKIYCGQWRCCIRNASRSHLLPNLSQ